MPKKWWLFAFAVALLAASHKSRIFWKSTLFLLQVLPLGIKPLDRLSRAPAVDTRRLESGEVDIYRSNGRTDPWIVLIHGANPGGNKDPRVTNIAQALSRSGRTVIVPNLSLGDWKLDVNDLSRISEAISFGVESSGQRVVLLTFSFGSAFSLVALGEDPALQEGVRLVATVGCYFDLVNLLQGVTTGKIVAADTTTEWHPVAEAGHLVTMFLGGFLEETERGNLLQAYSQRNGEGLSKDARTIYDFMTNHDPTKTRQLLATLPGELPALVRRLSPATSIDRIKTEVIAMHSVEDPASPIGESRLLVEHLGNNARLYVIRSFRHVTPTDRPLARIKDAKALMALMMRIFSA